MFEIVSAVFLFAFGVVASYLLGKNKARVEHEKELNDALEHEAQSWADIASTDDDFIRVQQGRINRKHKAKD